MSMDDNPYRESTRPATNTGNFAPPQPPTKPASIKVFAILHMVLGGLGICGGIGALVMFAIPQPGNPALEVMVGNPVFSTFNKVSILLSLIMGIVLVVAGIGLLKYALWGRTLSLIYAWYTIVATIVGSIASFFFLILPLMEQAGGGGPNGAAAVGGAIGGLIGGVFALIYPIFILVFMYKQDVKDALE